MVLPNFWFGLFSIYSATFIYEKFIYLLYNIVFTSVPIVWFALFDYQFPRELFLIDPKKYKIGLNGECFGTKVFWYWFCYGAVQAFLIILFAFYCVDWETSSIYKSGGIVLGAVVLIVNIQIYYQSHVFDGIFVFVLAASVALYFGVWAFMSLDFYGNDFLMGTYAPAMNEPITYLGLFLILVVVYMLEKLTIIVTGQLYSLKYDKEKLQAHLSNKNQVF
jgi:phospholipid-transporting ATPase